VFISIHTVKIKSGQSGKKSGLVTLDDGGGGGSSSGSGSSSSSSSSLVVNNCKVESQCLWQWMGN
jgi:hypothetical protein